MTIKKNIALQNNGKRMASASAKVAVPSSAAESYDHGDEMDEDEEVRVVACGGVLSFKLHSRCNVSHYS